MMFSELVIQRLQELGISPETLALARGILLGDKTAIDPQSVQQFRIAGMSHLLAVSGLHVGVIMSLVWAMLKPVEAFVSLITQPRMSVYYASGIVKRMLVILLTVLYVWTIGAPTSAVRAALMLCLCMVGWMLHRPTSPWNCLLLAALILIASDPWNIVQVGFQLSFLAVAGILLFQPWLQDDSMRWWERMVLLSIAAQWLTAPFVAYYFHQVPFLGWLQGLLVVPLIPFFVGSLLVGILFPAFHWLCVPIEAFHHWLNWASGFIVSSEQYLLGGHLYFYPSWWEVALSEAFFLLLIAWLRLRRHRLQASESLNPQ